MTRYFIRFLVFAILLIGCGVQVASQVEFGRAALKAGNPEVALTYFQRGAESQPDYVVNLPPLQQSIWTYLGRAYYETGKLTEAREALSQALKRNEGDFIARLYIGLVLLRLKGPAYQPDNSFALKDILYALLEKVSAKRLGSLVKERGVNFDLTAEGEKELRKAGADNELLEEIRIAVRERTKIPESPARQGLREVERALKEIQSWQARIRKTDYGQFWDARKRLSAQVETSLSMIAAKKMDSQDFIAGLENIGKIFEEEVELARRNKEESDRSSGARPG
jgi:tetratricopeptide (TPR) repeat protein